MCSFILEPLCFCSGITSSGPCGVTAEALAATWPPSSSFPRPVSHRRERTALYSSVVCDLFFYFFRPPSLVMFFQPDSTDEDRNRKGKDRVRPD